MDESKIGKEQVLKPDLLTQRKTQDKALILARAYELILSWPLDPDEAFVTNKNKLGVPNVINGDKKRHKTDRVSTFTSD